MLEVLSRQRGQVLAFGDLTKQVDSILAEYSGAHRLPRESDRSSQLDSHDRFERSQRIKRKTSSRTPLYSNVEAKIAIPRLQAVIRKETGTKATAWRRRWIHWDWAKETVIFERQ